MRIILRPVTSEDSYMIVKWRNSEKVKSHCFTKAPISEESNQEFYNTKILSGKYKQFIVDRIDDSCGLASYPIATIYLKDLDYENGRCELCVFTSDDVEWNAKGQSIAIKMMIDKAFQDYNMHKIYSYVFYKNYDEIELLKESGFTVEAILKDEAKGINGEYEDIVRLSIFNDVNIHGEKV